MNAKFRWHYISVWSIVPSGLASLCEFEYRNFMEDSKIPLASVSRTSKLELDSVV